MKTRVPIAICKDGKTFLVFPFKIGYLKIFVTIDLLKKIIPKAIFHEIQPWKNRKKFCLVKKKSR
jgi:hypothetical protein